MTKLKVLYEKEKYCIIDYILIILTEYINIEKANINVPVPIESVVHHQDIIKR